MGADCAADAESFGAGSTTDGGISRSYQRGSVSGPFGVWLADAADPLWAVADDLLVVPAPGAKVSVSDHPRPGIDARSREGGPGGQPHGRRARQPDGEGARAQCEGEAMTRERRLWGAS